MLIYFVFLLLPRILRANNILIMPEVARFYGIIIKMFFKPKEHDPARINAL